MCDRLDVKHGDIIYRQIYEDQHGEQVLWANTETRKLVSSVGHKYEAQDGEYLTDSDHPWNQSEKDYPVINYRNYFDLVGKVVIFPGTVNLIKKLH